MQNELKNFIDNFKSNLDVGMSRDVKAFLEGDKNISKYQLNIDEKERIIIDIELQKFSYVLVNNIWGRFVDFIGYEYLNLYIKEELDEHIKFSYITADKHMYGVKIEMYIS